MRKLLAVGIVFMLAITVLLAITQGTNARPVTATNGLDQRGIEQAMGRPGAMQSDGTLKFSMPRSDLKVMIGDIRVAPALALGSWVAFREMENGTMAMGDLVLTEAEVNAVIDRLQRGGVEQTALHNHLMGESPRVMYMHIEGRGDPVAIASTIRDALTLTGTPMKVPAGTQPPGSGLNTSMLDSIIGVKGKYSGNVYQLGVARAEKITDKGEEVPPSMGVATSVNFQPLGDGKVAIAGDFVLTEDEVNPVIRALRDHGINVTAVHSHMLHDEPRLFFMHYWATGDQGDLAAGIGAALDQTNSLRNG